GQATGQDVSHAFLRSGTYTVALRVTDSDGASSLDTLTVTVRNVAPTANAGPNQTINANGTAAFHGTATEPGVPGGDTLTYEWDFNYDGVTFHSQATGQDVSRLFTTAGVYHVALRVTDSDGGVSAISTATVTVTAQSTGVDLVMQGIATPYGDTRVVLTYRIAGSASLATAVQLALYASSDNVINARSLVQGTTTIGLTELDAAGNLALAPGTHTLLRTTSDLGFPTNSSSLRYLASSDYYLIARLDSGNAVLESDELNNDRLYSGIYQVAGNHKVFVQGSDTA